MIVRTSRMTAMLAIAAALVLTSNSQRRWSPAPSKAFTSPDNTFRFSYPADFHLCTARKMDPCILRSFVPPCDDDAIVCVVYPKEPLQGTNFGSAAFQVREIHIRGENMTPDVCVTPYPETDDAGNVSPSPEFLISAVHPEEIIGGVPFVHGIRSDAAMGHSSSVDLYRAFHRQKCYELRLTQSQSNAANYDPPIPTVTPAQQKEVSESLSRALHSFRFLN